MPALRQRGMIYRNDMAIELQARDFDPEPTAVARVGVYLARDRAAAFDDRAAILKADLQAWIVGSFDAGTVQDALADGFHGIARFREWRAAFGLSQRLRKVRMPPRRHHVHQ